MARYLVPSTRLTVISSNTRLVIVLYAKHTQNPLKKIDSMLRKYEGTFILKLESKSSKFFQVRHQIRVCDSFNVQLNIQNDRNYAMLLLCESYINMQKIH